MSDNVSSIEFPLSAGHAATRSWSSTALFLLVGYFCMTHSFAYLGIPEWKIFVGEVVLGAFLVSKRSFVQAVSHLMRQPRAGLRWGWWLFVFFVAYGIFEVGRGVKAGYSLFPALEEFAFHYYPLYFVMGLWVGWTRSQFLPRFIRILAWCNGIYGLTYVLYLSQNTWIVRSSPDVPVFGQPLGSAVSILGLLFFEKKLRDVWHLLLVNTFVMIAIQVRAEWLGFFVGLVIWATLERKLKYLFTGGALVAFLLATMYLINFSIPSPGERGGTVSAHNIVGRVLAPVAPDTAAKYTSEVDMYAGTVTWRTVWWASIFASTFESTQTLIFGHSYGYALRDLVPYLSDAEELRTPHNVFFFTLGYGGWVGVIIFFSFQAFIFSILWNVRHFPGGGFGLIYFGFAMSFALFSNFFETPYGAIPYYLLTGFVAAPYFRRAAAIVSTHRQLADFSRNDATGSSMKD